MRLAFHLFVTWVVWGFAYVAIAESLDGLPPFGVAGPRFVIAGLALLAIDRLRSAGAAGYLAKPVSIMPFMNAVKELLPA